MILGALFIIIYPGLQVLGLTMFFGNGVSLCLYLYHVSDVSTILTYRKIGTDTIPAAAFERGCTLAGNADELAAHSRFMFYLMNARLGVEFFGIPVTRSNVVKYFVQVVVVLPTVYKVMSEN